MDSAKKAELFPPIDCGMGGHSIFCPVVQVSVFLDDANAETGTLRFLAGSWRFATPPPEQGADRAVVEVSARAGDCTLHYGDTMHAAPAPTGNGPYRRSIVMSFYQPRLLDIIWPGQAFNDVLLGRDDGHVESM